MNFSGGFVNSQKLLEFFAKHLKNTQIENLPINYAAIAFDIIQRKTVIINAGNLSSAMLASASLPLIFKPFKFNNYLLCDGGVEYPLPVDFAHIFNRGYKVVAVNVLPPISHQPQLLNLNTESYNESKRNNIMLSLQVTMYNQAFLATKSLLEYKPDYYISAYSKNLSSWDFIKVSKFYEIGVKSAKTFIEIDNKETPFEEFMDRFNEFKKRLKMLKIF